MNAINDTPSLMDQRIIRLVRSRGQVGCQDIAADLDMNPFAIHGWLKTLCDEGHLCKLRNGMFAVPNPGIDPVGGAA